MFRAIIYKKEGEEWFDKKCEALQTELKANLGEEAIITNFPHLVESILFKITVPLDREDSADEIIRDTVEKHFPWN